MSNLLLLNTSLCVKKPLFSRDSIKIEYGDKRIESYKKGFESLNKLDLFKQFEKIILIDNTLSSKRNIPETILKELPKNTTYLVTKDNKLGRLNKGAGMLQSLQKNSMNFKDHQLIFYFEPRLILKTKNFIETFLDDNKNYFSLESKDRVKSGYFGTTSVDFIQFLESYSAKELIEKNLHIELLLYDFYKIKKTKFLNSTVSLWKNYLSEKYEEY